MSPRRSLSAARRCSLVFFGAGFFSDFNFGFRRVALGRIAFLRMRRRGRQNSEILLHLAFGDLAAPHRFRDQLVGQNQPRIRDVFHHQHNGGHLRRCARLREQDARHRLRCRPKCRGTACGPDAAPPSRFSPDGRHSVRNPSAAPAAGRCRAMKSPGGRRGRSDRRHPAPATAPWRSPRSPRSAWFHPAVPP